MTQINTVANVELQYNNSSNLDKRISVHAKYSTNKIGFLNWIFSNYKIIHGMKVLELGCGNAEMWVGKDETIRQCDLLVLSDFSQGMVDVATEKLLKYENIQFSLIDIQSIPFADDSFDVIIANMMLYHVPNLDKALSEVRRVLKDNGTFYCATFGQNSINEYLASIFSDIIKIDKSLYQFTLQNGKSILNKYFKSVERLDYKDSLAVTDLDDIVEYIYSMKNISRLSELSKDTLKNTLSKEMVKGVLNIPKEYGMFIAT